MDVFSALRQKRQRPFIVVFSGPSSSGKSTIIKQLLEEYYTARSFPSISRSSIKKFEDRLNPEVQQRMLEKAIARDQRALKSNADLVLLDRCPLDGYVYCLKYNFDKHFLDDYYVKTMSSLQTYDLVILLDRYVFKQDYIRSEIDRKFDEFNDMYKRYYKAEAPLIEIPAADLPLVYKSAKSIIEETARKVQQHARGRSRTI